MDCTPPEQVIPRLERHLNTGAVHLFGGCSILQPPTRVTLLAIDRLGGRVALKPSNPFCLTGLEAAGVFDQSADVMLDPLGEDFSTKKVQETLQGIGNPPSAVHDNATLLALGYAVSPRPGNSPETQASTFLWRAETLAQTLVPVVRDTAAARAALENSRAAVHGEGHFADARGQAGRGAEALH